MARCELDLILSKMGYVTTSLLNCDKKIVLYYIRLEGIEEKSSNNIYSWLLRLFAIVKLLKLLIRVNFVTAVNYFP